MCLPSVLLYRDPLRVASAPYVSVRCTHRQTVLSRLRAVADAPLLCSPALPRHLQAPCRQAPPALRGQALCRCIQSPTALPRPLAARVPHQEQRPLPPRPAPRPRHSLAVNPAVSYRPVWAAVSDRLTARIPPSSPHYQACSSRYPPPGAVRACSEPEAAPGAYRAVVE